MSQLYELHICTFGARNYAHMIAMFLDQDGKYFSHRILSRDECFNSNSKTANLSALFPCGDKLVCIIDDREDVWNFAPNLIHVKPYHFFKHTGDINAPPGLTKHENDEKEGFVFGNVGNKTCAPLNKEVQSEAKGEKKEEELKAGAQSESIEVSESENVEGSDEGNRPKHIEKGSEERHSAEAQKEKEEEGESIETDTTKDKSVEVEKGNEEGNKEESNMQERKLSTEEKGQEQGLETEIEMRREMSKTVPEQQAEGNKAVSTVPVDKECSAVDLCMNNSTPQKEETAFKSEKEATPIGKEVDVEDRDDYLLYLEGILKTIHNAFYQMYDDLKGDIPDLKTVIPYVRRKVLAGTRLVFSGLVPTHIPLEKSRVYQVARSLGAVITADIDSKTTHLVAVRPGTAKVITARKMKTVTIVTPEWLWCCAERWERVEEKLYPLGRGQMSRRHPPPHCGSPEHCPAQQAAKANARFIDSINPLMSFSSEDIEKMDREVDDIFNETESDGEGDSAEAAQAAQEQKVRRAVLDYDDSSSSSADSLSGEHPHGWGSVMAEQRKRKATDSELDDLDEDMPSTKFRRGEALPSDLELGEDESASNGSEDPPDEIDDGDWNMMGAALEREFLSGNRD